MRIIRNTPDSNGAYPPPQAWSGRVPEGYAVWPDSLSTEEFEQHNGFVVLTIHRGWVAGYEINQEAWEPAPEPEGVSDTDVLNTLLGVS